ncbi:fimbrin [Trifolium repens]|nr:fimbrin [Trifolium repens]
MVIIFKKNYRVVGADHLPEQDSIFSKIKQCICRRINRKKLLQEFIFGQVTVNMCNIRSLLRFINCMMNSRCSCLQK